MLIAEGITFASNECFLMVIYLFLLEDADSLIESILQ